MRTRTPGRVPVDSKGKRGLGLWEGGWSYTLGGCVVASGESVVGVTQNSSQHSHGGAEHHVSVNVQNAQLCILHIYTTVATTVPSGCREVRGGVGLMGRGGGDLPLTCGTKNTSCLSKAREKQAVT